MCMYMYNVHVYTTCINRMGCCCGGLVITGAYIYIFGVGVHVHVHCTMYILHVYMYMYMPRIMEGIYSTDCAK